MGIIGEALTGRPKVFCRPGGYYWTVCYKNGLRKFAGDPDAESKAAKHANSCARPEPVWGGTGYKPVRKVEV